MTTTVEANNALILAAFDTLFNNGTPFDVPPPHPGVTSRVRSNRVNADSEPVVENPYATTGMVAGENLLARLLYIQQLRQRDEQSVIEVSDEEQFAKGQGIRDLRVSRTLRDRGCSL
jgi:hypothetical protein